MKRDKWTMRVGFLTYLEALATGAKTVVDGLAVNDEAELADALEKYVRSIPPIADNVTTTTWLEGAFLAAFVAIAALQHQVPEARGDLMACLLAAREAWGEGE